MTVRRIAIVVSILVMPSFILWALTAARTPSAGQGSAPATENADAFFDSAGFPREVEPTDGDLSDDPGFDDLDDTEGEFGADLLGGAFEGADWDLAGSVDSAGGAYLEDGYLEDSYLYDGGPGGHGSVVGGTGELHLADPGSVAGPGSSAPRPAAEPAPRPSMPAPAPSSSPTPAPPRATPAPASSQPSVPDAPPHARSVVLPTSCGGLHVAVPDRDGWRNLTWMTHGGQQMNILGLGWNPAPSIGALVRADAFWVSVSCGAPASLERSEIYVVTACGVLRSVNGPAAGTRRVTWVADRQPEATMNAAGAGWTSASSVDVRSAGSQFGVGVRCSTGQHLMLW